MPTRTSPYLAVSFLLYSAVLLSQPMFTNRADLLPDASLASGVAMAIVDMNLDGREDIVRLENGIYPRIEFQQPDGSFATYFFPSPLTNRAWAMVIADVDQNGARDIVMGGTSNSTRIFFAAAPFMPTGFTEAPLPEIIFLQGANFADINNDGLLDFFGCDDVDISKPYRFSPPLAMQFDGNLIAAVSSVPSDNSGNYASLWTDYDDDGDLDMYLSKCRQGVSNPNDGRRINQLFQNNGDGTFTDVAATAGLIPFAQSWSADFADIDNDGDLDCFIVNHDLTNRLYRNEGDNTYTDITETFLVSGPGPPSGIQCNFDDFNNDGWVDLLLTNYLGAPLTIFQNNGGLSMTYLPHQSVISNQADQPLQSAVTGDLNNDGYLDLYGGYAANFNSPTNKGDVLFYNTLSGNNYLKFNLTGVSSNTDAIGAKIKIYADEWGVQTREVRSGEGYGVMNSMVQHFGLGATTTVDSVVIRWPGGLTERLSNVPANQTMHVTEGELAAALPLDWLSFSASVDGKVVTLNWSTESERATSHFVVTRSTDLENWQDLQQVPASNMPGRQNYRTADPDMLPGTSYYRLRQVDLNGTHSYGPVASVSRSTEDFAVFPNPAKDWLTIQHSGEEAAPFSLETLTGAVLRRATVAPGGKLSLGGLAPGVYLLRSGPAVKRIVVY